MHSSHSRRLFFIFPGVVFHVPVALAAISVQFSKAILSEIPNVRMIGRSPIADQALDLTFECKSTKLQLYTATGLLRRIS